MVARSARAGCHAAPRGSPRSPSRRCRWRGSTMAPEASAHEMPVAGWYPDPESPRMARYWDGSRWTDDRRPLDSKEEVSGWLLFLGYAGAIFLPIVGLIIGIALLVKKATG